MKKKLRLSISRIISTFQTCRQKPSASPSPSPSPSPPVFYLSPLTTPKMFDIESPTVPPPPRPSPSRRIATVMVSAAGCRSSAPMAGTPTKRNLSPAVDIAEDDLSRARETPAYLWRKEEKWHVVTCAGEFESRRKMDCEDGDDEEGSDGDEIFHSSFRKMASRRRRREKELRQRRRLTKSTSKCRNSTSSVPSDSWFSSNDEQNNHEREENNGFYDDEGGETDTLLSSRRFSTDSSVMNPHQRPSRSPESSSSSRPSGAAAMLGRLVPCGAEQGKVKESFAVVKKSEDPRGDFRKSMAEMVVEKGLYDAAELEQLLHCFLSLNSTQHHRAIVAAFADVWEALFTEERTQYVDCK